MGPLLGLNEMTDVRALSEVEMGSYTNIKCHVKRHSIVAMWA